MTGLSSKKPPRNIRRVDHDPKRDHGWVVTLQRKGESIVKQFSDGIYGGKRESLKAAVQYRDDLLAQDEPFDHQIWIRTRLRKNNRSGIPGVHRYEVIDNRDTENVRVYWIAAWTNEHGVTRQRKFSVARYGESEAKRLAIAEREYQLNRVCAINAADREFRYPDQARIWEATKAQVAPDRRGQGKTRTGKARLPSRTHQDVDYERGGQAGIRTIEATIDEHGNVRLLEPVKLTSTRRALVTILPEAPVHPRGKR
jgi:hypothetical protein